MADLLPTDALLVNRAGIDYSVPQSDVMADVLDTDLLLVNRNGVDYQATYADVKRGFGPEKIAPAPEDWTFNPAIVSGTGTQVDPFIITPETVTTTGGFVQSAQTLTLTGLTPDHLVEWIDNSIGAGIRFNQPLGVVPSSGQVDIRLKYLDTPDSTATTVYTGDLQIGTSHFRWVVTQQFEVAPVIGTVVLADSPEPDRFTSSTFATTVTMTDDGNPASTKGLKAWVEGTLKTTAISSAITNVSAVSYSSGASPVTPVAPQGGGSWENVFNGSTSGVVYACNQSSGATGSVSWSASASSVGAGIPFTSLRVYVRLRSDGSAVVNGTTVATNTGSAPLWVNCNVSSPLNTISMQQGGVGACTLQASLYAVEVDGVILSDSVLLSLTDNQNLDQFIPGDAVTELGNLDDGTGTVDAVDTNANTMTLSAPGGTWDVGSQVKGPQKDVLITPESDVITAVTGINRAAGVSFLAGTSYPGRGAEKAFDGDLTEGACDNTNTGTDFPGAYAEITFDLSALPIVSTTGNVEVYLESSLSAPAGSRTTATMSVNGGGFVACTDFYATSGQTEVNGWQDLGVQNLTNFVYRAVYGGTGGPGIGRVYAFRIDGTTLVVDSTVLTFATDQDLTQFANGDAVNQDSSYSPLTSAITNVSSLSYSQGATPVDLTSPVGSGSWTSVFNGQDETTNDTFIRVCSEQSGGGRVTTWSATSTSFGSTIPFTTLRIRARTSWISNSTVVVNGVNLKSSLPDLTYTWVDCVAAGVTSPLSTIEVYGGVDAGTSSPCILSTAFVAVEVDGVILSDSVLLSLADDTDLENLAVEDAVTEVGGIAEATGTVSSIDAGTPSITLTGSSGTWDVGNQVLGPSKTASGTVDSTDATALTMTLSSSTGTWAANAGKYVIGPEKPSANVKLYTLHDAAGAVSDLQSADPGYVTMTGSSPYTLTFPAIFPTGNAPDVDLPAGTSITTEIQATNIAGTDVETSNTIVPS